MQTSIAAWRSPDHDRDTPHTDRDTVVGPVSATRSAASTLSADHGWIAALNDPVLAPALSLLHREPDRKWTVAELASGVAVSRSLLDARFRRVLGRSPIRYLTEWRMHLAEQLLATTGTGVAVVARRVGYESAEAFSRAFKRARGISPSHWRARRPRDDDA